MSESNELIGNNVYELRAGDPKVGDKPPGGGGGGTMGGMEARLSKLEAAVEHIQTDMADLKADVRGIRSEARTDFRSTFAALIVVALGLAGLMARGFHWL